MKKAWRLRVAEHAKNGAAQGFFLGVLALAFSLTARAVIPEVRRASIDASTRALMMTYLLGGPALGATAGVLGMIGSGRAARVAIGIVVTSLAYIICLPIISPSPVHWDGRTLFSGVFVSLTLGTFLGLRR